jgi:deoxyribodipyrimidine photo-lyase
MLRFERALCWLRRDLRDHDHAALAAALAQSDRVYCAFVYDTAILEALDDRADRRVEFIHASVAELDRALAARGGGLIARHGDARTVIPSLAARLRVGAVFVGRDYEPQAKARDAAVASALAREGIRLVALKDQAIFDGDEVLTKDGRPFSVYTPYRNAWLTRLTPADLAPRVVADAPPALAPDPEDRPLPSLEDIGFRRTNLSSLPIEPGMSGARRALDSFLARIGRYRVARDFPADDGTSNLSMHLRFGTVSVRTLAREAQTRIAAGGDDAAGATTWLSELVWRDFFFMILDRHPHVVAHAYKPELDALPFPSDPALFAAWREGRTGYPLVDAAMRQLAATGMMHNRLRMVTASVLVKDLHVDWRKGERWFAAKLNDYDLAANNGNWQWVASTGSDAQPYFRIFNPVTQSERFDPEGAYIRRFVPELASVPAPSVHAPWKMPRSQQSACGVVIGRDYPTPVVDHGAARKTTLALYGVTRRGTP